MLSIRFLQLPPGEIVFTQGELANSVFYIRSGGVRIRITQGGKGWTIADLHAGEFFGEHCLSDYLCRPNTATTLEKTTLVEIDKHEMVHTLEMRSKWRELFIRNLIEHKSALERILIHNFQCRPASEGEQ
jgi:CRP/FNR family transcriptional regulator, cyclic AMP receptor protein